MTRPSWTIGTCLAAALLAASPSRAQEGPAADDVARARESERALVERIAQLSRAFVAIGGGSGVIVSPDGEILTNHHVAGSRDVGETWYVTRPGGAIEEARLIGTDPRGDVTLLRLLGTGPYPYVELGDSDSLQPGDLTIALGNPFGYSKDGSPHATVGVVSANHRFQVGGYTDCIQTDAAINPGNSGGPLFDARGRLVGINGRIAVRFGTRNNTGVGYAIGINQIRAFLPHLRRGGVVGHVAVRGLVLGDAPNGGTGAAVRRVQQGTNAFAQGLRNGDVIVEADDREVANARRLWGILGTLPAGDPIVLRVRRGAETLEVTLHGEARDRVEEGGGAQGRGGYLGIRMSTSPDGGVEVEEITPGGPAESAGLLPGDVVSAIAVAGRRTLTPDVRSLVTVLSRLQPGAAVVLAVRRGSDELEVEVTLGERQGRRGR